MQSQPIPPQATVLLAQQAVRPNNNQTKPLANPRPNQNVQNQRLRYKG